MDIFFSILWLGLFLLLLLAGLLSIPFGLPGTLVILGAGQGYGFLTDFRAIDGTSLWIAAVLAATAEGIEFLVGIWGGKRYGASRAGLWGGFFGGFVGGIVGAGFGFGLGAIPGGLLGTLTGGVAGELLSGKTRSRALGAGYGAFLGRLWGGLLKIALAWAMVGVFVWGLLR